MQDNNLHGNNARLGKNKKLIGTNVTNQAVLAGKPQTPHAVNDEMAAEAREFSEENKK